MAPFHAIVREWYALKGGEIEVPVDKFVKYIMRVGDADYNYHFRYLLAERNGFEWAHWNDKLRYQAWLEGTSL
jgi:hypothetical protein